MVKTAALYEIQPARQMHIGFQLNQKLMNKLISGKGTL